MLPHLPSQVVDHACVRSPGFVGHDAGGTGTPLWIPAFAGMTEYFSQVPG